MSILTFPATPVPAYLFQTGQAFKTLISDFDSGAETRRKLIRFAKRNYSMGYNNITLANRNILNSFYRNVGGMADSFWIVDWASRTWNDEYVGRGGPLNLVGALAADGTVFTNQTVPCVAGTANGMYLLPSIATDATGDTDGSTAVITGMTDTSDFFVGESVEVSAGFATTGPYTIISKTTTTMTISVASNAVVANITVHTTPHTPAVDDAYYFGSNTQFDLLTLTMGQAGAPAYNPGVAGWVITWEYWDGDSWDALAGVTDNTVGFTAAAGARTVLWTMPADWVITSISGVNAYWVRARVSTFETITVRPLGSGCTANSYTYDLHGLTTSAQAVYIDGVLKTGGGADYTVVAGGGGAGSDRITFTAYPSVGTLITSDFTGYLRLKARLGDDVFKEEIPFTDVFNVGLKLEEVQVVKSLPAEITAELAKDVMHIKHLITLALVSATYYWTEGADNIYYGGHWYESRGLSFEQATVSLSSQVDSLTLNVANVDKAFSTLVLSEDIRGRPVTVQRIFLDVNLDIIGTPSTIFLGYIDAMEIDRKRARIECYNHMIKWKTMTPKRQHFPTCHWEFKSTECGYTGTNVRNGISDKLAEWTRSMGTYNYTKVDDYLTDLTIAGTFTEDSNDGAGHVVANAFDDTAGTYWQSEGVLPDWICCQFAAAKTIIQYTMTPQTQANSPSNFRLEGSADGLTWVVLDMQSNVWWPTTPLKRTFDVRLPGSYVYYRLWVLSNFGNAATQIKEFELIGSSTMVNDADYNYTTNVATKADLFGYSDIILSSDATTIGVGVRVRSKQTVADARTLGARLKMGGAFYDSATILPTDVYANNDFTFATNPATGLAWTYLDFRVPPDMCDRVNSRDSLLHLDGENESQNIIDEYGKLWTAYVEAMLEIADKIWGTASLKIKQVGSIRNSTITSLLHLFTIEGWFHTDDITEANQDLIKCGNALGAVIEIVLDTATNKLVLYVSSDGANWDIANAVAGAKDDYVDDTWYKWALDYDGVTYRFFIGTVGALAVDISVASGTPPAYLTYTYIGHRLGGNLDEVRVTVGRSKYGASASAETAAFSTESPIYADSYNTTYYPSNVIDDNVATYWLATAALPHWIAYLFSSAIIIKQYSILPTATVNRAPHDFVFQGSNDGLTWTDLDTQVGVTGWVSGTVKFFKATNTTAYLYYRLYITANDGGTANYIEIAELAMYETIHIEQFGYFTEADAGGDRIDVSDCYLQVTSDVTWCDYTHDRCVALNNLLNFGGFKYMPELAIKEYWWGSKQRVWTAG